MAAMFLLGLFVVFLLAFFWPGPYRHDEIGTGGGRSYLVRVNRFTGRTELFSPREGWEDRFPGFIPTTPLLIYAAGGSLLVAFFGGFFLGRRATLLE